MQWEKSDAFEPGDHGNKPFAIRIPSLLVSRGSSGPPNFLTAMWFTAAGADLISQSENIVRRGAAAVQHDRDESCALQRCCCAEHGLAGVRVADGSDDPSIDRFQIRDNGLALRFEKRRQHEGLAEF